MFAGLALFVGAFLIVNTFAMLVAQRSRELAMLRAIGASRGQVTGTVIAEALVIGADRLDPRPAARHRRRRGNPLRLSAPRRSRSRPRRCRSAPATIIACYVIGIGCRRSPRRTRRPAGPASSRRSPRCATTRPPRALPARPAADRRIHAADGSHAYLIAVPPAGSPGAVLIGLAAAMPLLGVVMTSPARQPVRRTRPDLRRSVAMPRSRSAVATPSATLVVRRPRRRR